MHTFEFVIVDDVADRRRLGRSVDVGPSVAEVVGAEAGLARRAHSERVRLDVEALRLLRLQRLLQLARHVAEHLLADRRRRLVEEPE